MQQSNTYIIVFSAIMTVLIGGIMSLTSVVLKPMQDKQVELDTKKKILGAVMDISAYEDPNQILEIYEARVKSIVIDINGNVVEADAKGNPAVAEKINIQKNHKIDPSERMFPVFMFTAEGATKVSSYIFPMFGAGLWDWISGYVAIESDLNTIKGMAFDHKSETPGLGARITDAEVQNRFAGKKIYNTSSELVSVKMLKGEGNPNLSMHEVDGLSGATMTAKGVNSMLENYLKYYESFIKKNQSQSKVALNF